MCLLFTQPLHNFSTKYVGSFELRMEIKIIYRSPFPFADRANFGDFTLLFCRARLRNVQSFKTQISRKSVAQINPFNLP